MNGTGLVIVRVVDHEMSLEDIEGPRTKLQIYIIVLRLLDF